MKLVTFNSETTPRGRMTPPTISFSRKSASAISKGARELMGLNGGDLIGVHQDEENPEDWYVSLAADGFIIRENTNGGGGNIQQYIAGQYFT